MVEGEIPNIWTVRDPTPAGNVDIDKRGRKRNKNKKRKRKRTEQEDIEIKIGESLQSERDCEQRI